MRQVCLTTVASVNLSSGATKVIVGAGARVTGQFTGRAQVHVGPPRSYPKWPACDEPSQKLKRASGRRIERARWSLAGADGFLAGLSQLVRSVP